MSGPTFPPAPQPCPAARPKRRHDDPAELHVICVYSNPVRYRSRRRLHEQHQRRLAEAGVTAWVVEATFGERPAEVADPANPRHIAVRCDSEVWLKEAMINIAAAAIPADAKYLMWQDGDIEFLRPDWAAETIEALQHYAVVQPFSHAVDLGPDGEAIEHHFGFAYEYARGTRPGQPGARFMHPGFCWAWRRKAWDEVGGMIDRAICGAGDHHMALGLIGLAEQSLPGGVHPNYRAMVMDWQRLAGMKVRRDIGHVPGTILHHFHGWKADRRYQGRWAIVVDNQYDPEADVTRDSAGMLRLRPERTKLRDELRAYFRQRMEDGGRKSWPV
ncbi:MAG: hypothetical protein ACREEB_13155 [Caulobacteraceae bacterium]